MTHRENTAQGPDPLFHSSSGHMRLSLEPDPSVPCAVLSPQHLKHVQGAASVSARPMLLPRVRHREVSSPMNRRHILLRQFFFEGMLAVLSVQGNSSNGDPSLAYLDQSTSLLAHRRPLISPPADQLLAGLTPADTTHICSPEQTSQAKTALRKGSRRVSLQNWQETGQMKKPHLRRGLCVIHWGNLGAFVSLHVPGHPPSLS